MADDDAAGPLPPVSGEVIHSLSLLSLPFSSAKRLFALATWGLGEILRKEHVSTIVITGGETDVCVLATVLGAAR